MPEDSRPRCLCALIAGRIARRWQAEEARRAGADVVGAEDLVAAIKAGGASAINFDKVRRVHAAVFTAASSLPCFAGLAPRMATPRA